jgi:uncharacterized protein YbcV (DUF1398 family)
MSSFSLDQIKSAHSKVKSGTDFPVYIRDLKALGVSHYETFVEDGHTQFFGAGDYALTSPPKYNRLVISEKTNADQFKADLKAHQQGNSDYLTFCSDWALGHF